MKSSGKDKYMNKPDKLVMSEVVERVSSLTRKLLKDGGEPSDVAFALTSVATDMGLQVTGDALQVIPVLLNAIAHQAQRRVEDERADVTDGSVVDLNEIPAKNETMSTLRLSRTKRVAPTATRIFRPFSTCCWAQC